MYVTGWKNGKEYIVFLSTKDALEEFANKMDRVEYRGVQNDSRSSSLREIG